MCIVGTDARSQTYLFEEDGSGTRRAILIRSVSEGLRNDSPTADIELANGHAEDEHTGLDPLPLQESLIWKRRLGDAPSAAERQCYDHWLFTFGHRCSTKTLYSIWRAIDEAGREHTDLTEDRCVMYRYRARQRKKTTKAQTTASLLPNGCEVREKGAERKPVDQYVMELFCGVILGRVDQEEVERRVQSMEQRSACYVCHAPKDDFSWCSTETLSLEREICINPHHHPWTETVRAMARELPQRPIAVPVCMRVKGLPAAPLDGCLVLPTTTVSPPPHVARMEAEEEGAISALTSFFEKKSRSELALKRTNAIVKPRRSRRGKKIW